MDNKIFCENCRKDVNYSIVEKEVEGLIKHKIYKFNGYICYCNQCKNEIYNHSVNDKNLELLYNKYREYNNIISLEKIKEIPKKYGIGIRPLSILLNWGELTFTRYYKGDIPTKQYSDVLMNIFENPNYYKKILEKNKNLISSKAFNKSLNKTNEILSKKG